MLTAALCCLPRCIFSLCYDCLTLVGLIRMQQPHEADDYHAMTDVVDAQAQAQARSRHGSGSRSAGAFNSCL